MSEFTLDDAKRATGEEPGREDKPAPVETTAPASPERRDTAVALLGARFNQYLQACLEAGEELGPESPQGQALLRAINLSTK